MSHHPECIIKGCCMVAAHGYCHGDLHQLGDVYIFNAALENGETNWQHGHIYADKVVYVGDPDRSFERRGVIIVHKNDCTMNDAALAHLEDSRRPST